jgi:hypothetical protein
MSSGDLVRGPFGLDASKGQTVPYLRTVLVTVHTITAGSRLNDVVPLLESDRRIQLVYTCPPSALIRNGTERFLERLGALVIPWPQAAQARFDLAIAASAGLLEWVHAPVLSFPHGVGFNKYPAQWDGYGPEARRSAAGPESRPSCRLTARLSGCAKHAQRRRPWRSSAATCVTTAWRSACRPALPTAVRCGSAIGPSSPCRRPGDPVHCCAAAPVSSAC